jgi:hypothetical protein
MGMGMMVQSPYGLLDAEAVAKEVGLTDDQKEKIKTINEKAREEMRTAFQGMGDLEPQERQEAMRKMGEKMEAQRKATNKSLQGVLSEEQVTRLREIYVQIRGEQALRDAEVQEALGLSQDQKAKIRSIVEILTEEQKAAFEKMKGKKFDVSTLRMGGPGGFGPGGAGGFGPGRGPAAPGGERKRPAAKKEAPREE